LQRDSGGLATQNNELKIRLQAMEQQAKLRDGMLLIFLWSSSASLLIPPDRNEVG
jgi:hypothetical protein